MDQTTSNDLTKRFQGYLDEGHLVLTATLSTFVKSDSFAHHERFMSLWDKHFMEKVRKRLPREAGDSAVDHEYIVQCSPEGFWHFHGFLSTSAKYSKRLWSNEQLNRHLFNDLWSFRKAGPYRPCRVNSFQIEPVRKVVAWSRYTTRESDSISSFL